MVIPQGACPYCEPGSVRRPGLCRTHAGLLDVLAEFGAAWQWHPIPLFVCWSELRARKVYRTEAEVTQAVQQMGYIPDMWWPRKRAGLAK